MTQRNVIGEQRRTELSDEEIATELVGHSCGRTATLNVLAALRAAGYKVTLRDPCRCGCGKRRSDHLCPCGCGHTYEDAVTNVMGGVMALNWYQAEANIDEHPEVPCKWRD